MTVGRAIEVQPATADRWDDVVHAIEQPCWCLYWRLSAGDYNRAGSLDARRDHMYQRVQEAPAPGVLAYADGEAVGWCGLGPRTEFDRLARSRTIGSVDDQPVWSIVCFKIRVGYRRRGIARALLHGAINYARSEGAIGLEAYPVDPGNRRIDVTFAYVGTTAMFEAEGFKRIQETAARSAGLPRWLMRLELSSAGPTIASRTVAIHRPRRRPL